MRGTKSSSKIKKILICGYVPNLLKWNAWDWICHNRQRICLFSTLWVPIILLVVEIVFVFSLFAEIGKLKESLGTVREMNA